MDQILQFLQENPVFYVATMEGDQPRVRPFGFAMIYENRLYFGTGAHKKVFQQLNTNPRVEICTTSPQNEWIRICGRAVFDQRPATVDQVFEVAPILKSMYNEKTGLVMSPFYLEDATAEITDMKGGFRRISLNE